MIERVYISIEFREGPYNTTNKAEDSVSIEIPNELDHTDVNWLAVLDRLYAAVRTQWYEAHQDEQEPK